MISFSTCWNSKRHTAGDAMLREIRTKLGFDLIELDHAVRGPLMPGIQKIFKAGEIRISSVVALPGGYNFSAASTEESERAVTEAFHAIDLAAQLSAPFVILHLGKTNMPAITDRLIGMAKAGAYLSREYVRTKITAVQEREKNASECLDRLKSCLLRVIDYSAPKNIRIGLQTRRDYEQIPTERELSELLEGINSSYLGYWHDFGHSQVKENLAFVDHAEWLRTIGRRTFGCHVQDCIWPAREGQLPFTGDVDFEKLVPLLPTNCLFVWKMNPNKTADTILRSVQMWKERFGE